MNDRIITKRAVSLSGYAHSSWDVDVEFGCDTGNPQNSKETPECPICLTAFQENDIVSWSQNRECRHAFHQACILPWLAKDRQCPCCRQSFLGVSSDRTASSFFSVQLGLIDADRSTAEQKHLFQVFIKTSALSSQSWAAHYKQ